MKLILNRRNLFAAGGAAAATCAAATAAAPGIANAAQPSDALRRGATQIGPAEPVVEISSGKIRGFQSSGINVFRGIPYGAPTGGKNRFMPPQPVTPWTGVRDMLLFQARCPWTPLSEGAVAVRQEASFALYNNWIGPANEDCLHLNVWAPAGATNAKRPVLVWNHGGGFTVGDGHSMLAYDGENMARRGDAIVITHNHRLNAFGYLDLASYGGRWADSNNVGMQDIVAVLKWVQANIAQFGGDPNNVTVFGQSGGGSKVMTLMAMPSAKGLFHKAVVQSGAGGGGRGRTTADGQKTAKDVLAFLNISEANLDRLSDVAQDDICKAAQRFRGDWGPIVDGKRLPTPTGQSPAALAQGVPLLIGTIFNEQGSADNPEALTYDDAKLMADANQRFGAQGGKIAASYKAAYPGRTPIEIWHAIGASGQRESAFGVADRKFALDGKAWQYMFAWNSPVLGGRTKTYHSSEIAYVFDNAGKCPFQSGGGPAAMKLSAQMSDAWLAFARNGNPNHSGLPAWSAFDAKHPVMVFDDPCVVRNDPEREGRKMVASAPSAANTAPG